MPRFSNTLFNWVCLQSPEADYLFLITDVRRLDDFTGVAEYDFESPDSRTTSMDQSPRPGGLGSFAAGFP